MILGQKDELNIKLNELEGNSETFYRVYLPYQSIGWSFSLNSSLLYNVKATSTYDSTYSFALDDLDKLGNFRWELPWMIEINDPDLLDFVNTKYAIVANEAELPHANYEFVSQFNYVYIYENLNYKNLGIILSNVISYEGVETISQVNEYVICREEDIEEIKNYINEGYTKRGFDYVYEHTNELWIETTNEKSGFAVTSIPYDAGFTIRVNGHKVPYYYVNGGFIGFPVFEGYQTISMSFVPSGLKVGAILSGIGVLLLTLVILKESYIIKVKRRNG